MRFLRGLLLVLGCTTQAHDEKPKIIAVFNHKPHDKHPGGRKMRVGSIGTQQALLIASGVRKVLYTSYLNDASISNAN
jgi:hypothetical protein